LGFAQTTAEKPGKKNKKHSVKHRRGRGEVVKKGKHFQMLTQEPEGNDGESQTKKKKIGPRSTIKGGEMHGKRKKLKKVGNL